MHFATQFFLAHMKFKSKIVHLVKELASYIDTFKVDVPLPGQDHTVKIGQKSEKVHFLKCTFLLQMQFATKKKLAHVKIKNKISYLGKRISILHIQMTEQLSFEIL